MQNLIFNYFKKYPYVLVVLAIALIWMTINTIQANRAEKELQKNGKYTLGRITAIKGAHSGRFVDVVFEYLGREYQVERRNEYIPESWIGERILIKFLPANPINCEYYDHIEIPDSILKLPPVVWDSLPVKE